MASSLRASCSQLLRALPRSYAGSSTFPSAAASSSRTAFVAAPVASQRRSFSASVSLQSHIGSAPVVYPSTVRLEADAVAEELAVHGPLGIERVKIKPYVRLFHAPPADQDGEGVLEIVVDDQTVKPQRQMWGTTRQLIANAVRGVTEGYRVPVKLIGVGYRAAVEDAPCPPGQDPASWGNKKRVNLKLGYAHPILLTIPDHVTVDVPIPTKLFIGGTSLKLVTQFAADIRSHRKPEPYRGKGVFVGDETIKRKEGKKK